VPMPAPVPDFLGSLGREADQHGHHSNDEVASRLERFHWE
jgi:hypothetical protein